MVSVDRKTIFIILGVAAAVALILGLAIGLTTGNDDGPSLEDETLATIEHETEFPNGSFAMPIKELSPWNDASMAPKQVTPEVLAQAGIRTDDTSFIAESGRLTFVYVWLPLESTAGDPSTAAKLKGTRRKRQTSGVDAVGVMMGESTVVNVVPLELANAANSGLQLVQNSGTWALYELQIRIPELENTFVSRDDSANCFVVKWRPMTISRSDNLVAVPDFFNQMPVAVGSQCSPSGIANECSVACSPCGGDQVSGADTPVTRRYNLGVTSGDFFFKYETYTVRDRITVSHDGEIIHDSGCVGTNGFRSQTLSFSGKTSEVVVNVEPNCQGTTGTRWDFKLECPPICDGAKPPSGESVVIVRSEGRLLKANGGDSVYIAADGRMPEIEAAACTSAGAQQQMRWKVEIEELEIKGYKLCEKFTLPSTGFATGNPWMFKPPHGGRAKLTWKFPDDTEGSIQFFIKGTQPLDRDVVAAIGATPWYAEYIARHETANYGGLKQFDKKGDPIIGLFDSGNTFGLGIFQLTIPRPTCSQAWYWKENVAEGLRRLQGISNAVATKMTERRRNATIYNNGVDLPIPTQKESCSSAANNCGCVFDGAAGQGTSLNDQRIDDAVTIKRYNSAPQDYCFWNNKNPTNQYWDFGKSNGMGFNYVERVCSHVPKT